MIYVLKTFNTNIWNSFLLLRSSWCLKENLMKHPWYVWVMQRHKYIYKLIAGSKTHKQKFISFGLFNRKLLWWIMMGHLVVSSSRMDIFWIVKNIPTQCLIGHVHIWWQMEYCHRKHFIYVIILDQQNKRKNRYLYLCWYNKYLS